MGGGEREAQELGQALANRGHEVAFYSLPYLMGAKPKVDPRAVLGKIPYHEAWTHKIDADVAYTFYHPLSTLNFRVKGRRIASFHSQAFFQKNVSPRYGLVPFAASYGTRLIGPLELRAFDAVHTHFPQPMVNHRKRYVIPHWVDTEVFKPAGTKYDQFTVLFSGRMLWQKGWDIYVALARRMKSLGVRFQYVGGAMKDAFIQGLGFQLNPIALSQIYNDSHMLINPLRVETFGRAAIESMACGTPVLTARSAGLACPDLPFMFGNTIEEYERAIMDLKNLWEQGRPYRRLSERCHQAAELFSFEHVVNQYEKMFLEVVGSS